MLRITTFHNFNLLVIFITSVGAGWTIKMVMGTGDVNFDIRAM
jgi:hypothetical protein